MQKYIESSQYKLNVGFFQAYKCLLEALAADDRDTIFEVCEGNLYHKLSESLDLVKERRLELKLLNKQVHRSTSSFHGSMQVIDY